MALEIKGVVKEVGIAQQVTEKLKKRTLTVEHGDNPQYLEQNQFEAINDRCALLDNVKVGDEVNVHFNLKGRSYVGKDGKRGHFNSLALWKLDILKTTAATGGGYTAYQAPNLDDSEDSPF